VYKNNSASPREGRDLKLLGGIRHGSTVSTEQLVRRQNGNESIESNHNEGDHHRGRGFAAELPKRPTCRTPCYFSVPIVGQVQHLRRHRPRRQGYVGQQLWRCEVHNELQFDSSQLLSTFY